METITTHAITLHNDEINSLIYIMACLMRHCGHNPIQAEQCTLITHNNKKCDIKLGVWEDMYNINENLISLGLITTITEYEGNMYK